MATLYRIYGSDGAPGAPVDYSTPLAEVSGLSWDTPALAADTDWTFAVRAYDDVLLLEEQNTDARVRVVVGPAQEDLTGLPAAPIRLSATASAGGGAVVHWNYNEALQGAPPTGFRVYFGTPAVDYGTVAATVAYGDERMTYRAVLAGLAEGIAYRIGVRAYNATGEESNTASVELIGSAAGPASVEAFSISATS